MSYAQTSLFKAPSSSPIYELEFDPLPGLTRNTLVQPTNSTQANMPATFNIGQSIILGFERLVSSPDPANNGTPGIFGIFTDSTVPTVPTEGVVYNPYTYSSIYLSSTSGLDTSTYLLKWYNLIPTDDIKQELNLV
jgi:hypothetical protein